MRTLPLLDPINRILRNENLPMEELEIHHLGIREHQSLNLSTLAGKAGSFCVPQSFQYENGRFFSSREERSLLSQAYLIGNQVQYLINPISEMSVFTKAGALFLTGQSEDLNVPSFSGIMVHTPGTDEEPIEDGETVTIGGAAFKPKRFFILLDVPSNLLRLGGADTDKWLRDNITAALAAKVDAAIGSTLGADATVPQGIGYAITKGCTTKRESRLPDYDSIVELEKSIGSNFGGINLPISSPAFITNSNGRRSLRKTYIGVQNNTDPVFKDGKILDYPAFVSDCISNNAGENEDGNLLLFGNWKDLCIVQFGGYNIQVDPYTLKNKGKIQLCVNAYYDFKGLRGSAPTAGIEETQPNEYAYSFGALPIR